MIQRIQTLYFLLTSAAFVVFLFIPYANISVSGVFTDLMLSELGFLQYYAIGMAGISALTVLIFKNRALQIKVSIGLMISSLVFAGLVLYYLLHAQSSLNETQSFSFAIGSFISILPVIFLSLAAQNIRKDEKIVRSMDRLR